VGDPINAVRIFNEKEVDELAVFDIDATVEGREPNYGVIEKLAVECRMPLCYGGGISTPDQARRIVQLGVEKVALSSALVANPGLAAEISSSLGRQSVVAVLDVRRTLFGSIEVVTHNARRKARLGFLQLLDELSAAGIGELIINSVDRDGRMKGYDLNLVETVRERVDVPLTVLGGAGSLEDISALVERYGVIGAAAGSLFVFKGVHRAVLINYPSRASLGDLSRKGASAQLDETSAQGRSG
jgi:cyclase